MKSLEQKRKKLLKEILGGFFTPEEVSDFAKNYLQKRETEVKVVSTTASNRKQLDFDINKFFKIHAQIDLLITFAGNKLPANKFLELLLQLGYITATSGELSSSIYINEKIITETKHSDEFKSMFANASLALGDIYSRQALWTRSFKYIKDADSVFQNLNDYKGSANCENLLGKIYGEWGDLKLAKEHFEISLTYLEKDVDNALMGKIEANLGIIYNIQGDLDKAISFYRRALVNFEKIGDHNRVADVRHNIGMMYTKKKEFTNALTEFDESITNAVSSGYLPPLGMSYLSKAYIYTQIKDYQLAEAFANRALDICHKNNDKLSVADIYKVKGIVKRNLRRYAKAEDYFQTSLRINRELKNELNEAETMYELGILYQDTGKSKESKVCLTSALNYYKKISAASEVHEIQAILQN